MPTIKENRSAFLAAVLARALPDASPGHIMFAVQAMQDAARAHRRWGEACCNYPMTDEQQRRGDRRCERATERAVGDLRACIGHAKGGGCDDPDDGIQIEHPVLNGPVRTIRLSFGGDPRGPCGQLIISDMPGDGFGPGFAIYS